MSGCLIGLLASWTRPATAQRVDFYACVDDSTFYSESAVALVDTTYGTNFYSFRGRLAWAPLRNVGPITVSVWTRAYLTPWPLYVEIVQFNPGHSDTTCTTIYPGQVILATQGALQCEGVWETFGPLDVDHLVPRWCSSKPRRTTSNRVRSGSACAVPRRWKSWPACRKGSAW